MLEQVDYGLNLLATEVLFGFNLGIFLVLNFH